MRAIYVYTVVSLVNLLLRERRISTRAYGRQHKSVFPSKIAMTAALLSS